MTEIKKTIIAVMSPCGGTGVSVLCKELALILSRQKINDSPLRVCVIDTHNCNGSMASLMGFPDCRYNFGSIVKNMRILREHSPQQLEEFSEWNNIEKYLSFDRTRNIFVLTAPTVPYKPDANATETLTIIDAMKKHFDVLLIDCPQGIDHPSSAAAAEAADRILIATRPDAVSIERMLSFRADLKDYEMLDKVIDNGGLILNMYDKASPYMTPGEIEEYIGIPIISVIPYYAPTWTFINNGNSFVLTNTPVSKSYKQIASFIKPEIIKR